MLTTAIVGAGAPIANGLALAEKMCGTKAVTRENLTSRAEALGFKGVKLDGTNPVAFYSGMKSVIEGVRAGDGPVFVEAMALRQGPHPGVCWSHLLNKVEQTAADLDPPEFSHPESFNLARVELNILYEEMVTRLPEFRLEPSKTTTYHGGHVWRPDEIYQRWDL